MKAMLIALAVSAVMIGPAASQGLYGTSWVLESLHGNAVPAQPVQTMAIDPRGGLFGNGACNTYSGVVSAEKGGFAIVQMLSTLTACAAIDSEQSFFSALTAARRYVTGDGELFLLDDGKSPLAVFRQVAP